MCVEGTEPISSREASAANCLALSSWCFSLFWDRISCSPGWLLTILCSMTLNSFPYSLHVMGLVRFYVIRWIFKGICFVFVGCECIYMEIRGQVMEVFFYHEGPRDQTEFVKFVAGPLHSWAICWHQSTDISFSLPYCPSKLIIKYLSI